MQAGFYDQENKYMTIFYQNMISELHVEEDIAEVDVDFIYLPWWEPYLKVTPGKGELIIEEPFMSISFLPIMITQSHFIYDLSYPVVASIHDDEALDGRGFSLVFAFEVNLRNNEAFLTDDDFFDDALEATDVVTQKPLFPDPAFWTGGNVTIKTMNEHENKAVGDVILSYSCAGDEIYLGLSRMNSGEAILETPLPVCLGGMVTGFKKDYFITNEAVDSFIGLNQEVIVHAEPKTKINVQIVERITGKEYDSDGNFFWVLREGSGREVAYDEYVLAVFTRHAAPNEDELITQATIYGNSTELSYLELVSGEYTVEAYLFKSGVIIEAETICADDECFDLPKMEFNESFYLGGLSLTNETIGYLNISYDDLQRDKMVLPIMAYDVVDFISLTDLEVLDKTNEFVIDNPSHFRVSFVDEEEE